MGACTPRPPGLVAWWTGDGTALDLAGTNHAILENGVSYEPGLVGQAFNFDGSDDRAFIPESPAVDLSRTPQWTIEAWVKPTSLANPFPTIFSEGYWGASLGLSSGTGYLESWINNANRVIGSVAVSLNQWSHLALVYDGTNRAFYVNGEFAGSGSAPAILGDNQGAAIGDVAPSHAYARFAGQIDELSIYNRALTSNEIFGVYVAGSAGMCKAVLPPAILTLASRHYLALGSNQTLMASAIGTPPLTYQWLFNGATLTGAINAAFTLGPAETNQSGIYSVMVSNAYGSATSPIATVTVFPTPVDSTVFIDSDLTILAGQTNYDGGSLVIIGASVTMDGFHEFRSMLLTDGARVFHSVASSDWLDLRLSGDLIVSTNCQIDLGGRGYQGTGALAVDPGVALGARGFRKGMAVAAVMVAWVATPHTSSLAQLRRGWRLAGAGWRRLRRTRRSLFQQLRLYGFGFGTRRQSV